MCTIRPWLVGLALAILLVPSAAPAQPPPGTAPVRTSSELTPILPALQGSTQLVTATNGRATTRWTTSLTADAFQLVKPRDHARIPSPRDTVEVHPNVLSFKEATRLDGMRFAASPAVPAASQSAGGASKHRAVKWGALIGASVGVAGGGLQPTHSDGEYVLGNSRVTSALVLGGIGAGVGALVGLAIERSRQ